jgi:hypothetical protein
VLHCCYTFLSNNLFIYVYLRSDAMTSDPLVGPAVSTSSLVQLVDQPAGVNLVRDIGAAASPAPTKFPEDRKKPLVARRVRWVI